jgi:hypothetical protein
LLGKRTGFSVVTVTQTTVARVPPNVRVGPVLVLFEDPSTSAQSLELGATLARHNGAELALLVSAASEVACQAACADARTLLRGCGSSARCAWLHSLDGTNLILAARQEGAGCVVLADKQRFLARPGFARVLDEIECPIVLTRWQQEQPAWKSALTDGFTT